MSLFRTLAMLATATLVVMFFYFVGYAIANHEVGPALIGMVALAAAAVLSVLQVRLGRS